MTLTICGSMAFVDEQLRIKKHLEGMGHQVLISDYAESFQGKPMEEIEKQSLLHKVYSDAMKGHYEKIKNSDAILVLNYDRKGIANYIGGNTFKNCSLKETEFLKSNIHGCDFSDADFTKTTFKYSNFMKNIIANTKWNNTSFIEMQIQDIVFEGTLEDCYFENSAFYGVKFQNATLINTFFKNNKKFKRVQFIDCKVDKITYAFLKNNQADMTGISLLS